MMPALPAPNARRIQPLLGLAALLALTATAALSQATQQQGQMTLQLQAPLVLEDIVVLDSHNQPVHNLKAADFTLTDEGKPVRLQSFEEHAAPTPAQQAATLASAPKMPNLGVNVFTNYTPTPPDTPLNILVLDFLNTSVTDQANVQRQVLKYLSSQPAGVRMAIFGLTSHLYLLQGFTSDPALLKAAIQSTKGKVRPSNQLDDAVSSGDGAAQWSLDQLAMLLQSQGQGDLIGGSDGLEQFVKDAQKFQTAHSEDYTLTALDQLAHYLSALPGRKNLIWFAGTFPLNFIIPNDAFDPKTHVDFSVQVRKMEELLARSQVAVYPVSARGLYTNPASDASAGQTAMATVRGMNINHPVGDNFSFLQQNMNDHIPMDQVAEATGGKAFYNNGDLTEAVESAIALGSNYYTASFAPPSGKWDGRYHKIEIKVNQRGLHLDYRRGYYADDPALDSNGKKQPPASAMQAAMLHAAPQPSELLFDVRVIPSDGATDKLSPGSVPDPKLMQPPFRTFTLETLMDIHLVQMTATSAGNHQGSLEFTVLVYDAAGEVVNTKTRMARFNIPANQYEDLLQHGLTASQPIDVPAKGAYFIRIGIHDPASNRVGALEIPVAALKSKQTMILASTKTPEKR